MTQIEQIRQEIERLETPIEYELIEARAFECALELVKKIIDSLPAEYQPNIELIQRSWYMQGYTDGEFQREPQWILENLQYKENPNYGKELPDSPDFEAEWKWYTESRKDDMQTNAVTMNVKEVALYFAKWGRKQVLTAKPSEELEEEIHRYFKELEKSDCVSNTRRLAKHFAEWGVEQLKKQAGEAHPSEDLEKAALLYSSPMGRKDPEHLDEYPYSRADKDAFIAGAQWQKEQMEMDGNVILAEEDFDAEKEKSVEWGYNLCKEQMMNGAVEGRYMKTIDGKMYAETYPRINGSHLAGEDCMLIVIPKEDGR